MQEVTDLFTGNAELLRLLDEYRDRKIRDSDADWHDRVMHLGELEPSELSHLHGLSIAQGWLETRVSFETFETPGQLKSCYRLLPAGFRALDMTQPFGELSAVSLSQLRSQQSAFSADRWERS